MATNTETVNGTAVAPDGTTLTSGKISFILSGRDIDDDANEVIHPTAITKVIGNDGTFSAELWPNDRGTFGTVYRVVAQGQTAAGSVSVDYGKIQPRDGDGPFTLDDLLGVGVTAAGNVFSYLTEGQYNAIINAVESVEIDSEAAAAAALSAAGYASASATSAGEALASATAAATAAGQAASSAADAATNAASASSSASSAQASAIAAGAPIYANTTLGLAATSDGEFFYVPSYGSLHLYENDGGSATLTDIIGEPVFAARSALVSAISAGWTPRVGTDISVEGVSYEYDGSSTAISDMSGWKVLGDIPFDDFAAVLADTRDWYPEGQILRTLKEGFRDKVAASGASDHARTNAGGVKLYEVRQQIETIYADSASGDDDNHGRSADSPVQTLALAKAMVLAQGRGARVYLKAGSEWREEFDISAVDGVLVEGYGDLTADGMPIVRGDDVYSGAYEDSTDRSDANSNVYSLTESYSFSLGQQAVPPHWYEDDELLTWVADLATCQSTPGSFSHDASTSDVTDVTVYIHPTDSGNPAANGKTYSRTVRTWSVRVGSDSTVRLVRGMNQAHDNGSINGGDNILFDKCLANGSPIHDMLAASGVMRECVSWHPFKDDRSGAILLEFYRANADGHVAKWDHCIAVGKQGEALEGFGGHVASGLNDGSNLYDRIEVTDSLAYNASVNFDDAKHLYSERLRTVEGSVRLVSMYDSGSSEIIDPWVHCEVRDAGAFGGTSIAQTGTSTLTIDGARVYLANPSDGPALGGNWLNMQNSVIVLDGDYDPEFFRSSLGNMTDLTTKGNLFEFRGLGFAQFQYMNYSGATIDTDENVYAGFGEYIVNGTTYVTLSAFQSGESQDANSLAVNAETGSDLFGNTANSVGTGWTENGDGTWDQDGTGDGPTDVLRLLAGTTGQKLRFTFTLTGAGTVDVRTGATNVATNLSAGTYTYVRTWDSNISIVPTGTVVGVEDVEVFAIGENNPIRAKDPANGDFRIVGDVGDTLAGLRRPGVRYLDAPTSLADAEAWILRDHGGQGPR